MRLIAFSVVLNAFFFYRGHICTLIRNEITKINDLTRPIHTRMNAQLLIRVKIYHKNKNFSKIKKLNSRFYTN